MILPRDKNKLYDAVFEQLYNCTRTMDARAASYTRREAIYKRGSAGAFRGRLNKAAPVVNRQAALMFVPHMVRFFPVVPPEEMNQTVFDRADAVSDAVRLSWDELELDEIFPMGLRQALINCNAIFSVQPQVKTNWDIDLRVDLIHPRNFGVARETGSGSWDLNRQQAICVRSYHTLEELDRWLAYRPDRAEILSSLEYARVDGISGFSRITGMAPGSAQFQARPEMWPAFSGMEEEERPRIAAVFYTLRVFDDVLGDWRVFSISGSMVLRDRAGSQMGVPRQLPYVNLCPDKNPESFWGESLIENISPLQEWYLMRMEGMDEKFRKRLRPPTAAIGLGQGFEEKIAQLSRAGSRIAVPNQNAKIQQFPPEIAQEDFEMMQVIATQLNEQGQLPPLMRGEQPKGVRGEAVFNKMTEFASGEILQKSLVVEGAAKKIANLIFQNLRRYYTGKLWDVKNQQMFLIAEYPDDVTMKVDGHSSSPILMENHREEAERMLKYNIITPSRAVRLVAPAYESGILHDLQKIEDLQMLAKFKAQIEQQMKRGGKESAGASVEQGAGGA